MEEACKAAMATAGLHPAIADVWQPSRGPYSVEEALA